MRAHETPHHAAIRHHALHTHRWHLPLRACTWSLVRRSTVPLQPLQPLARRPATLTASSCVLKRCRASVGVFARRRISPSVPLADGTLSLLCHKPYNHA